MHAVPFFAEVLLLAAAITGAVYSLTSSGERRRRRGVLIGSIVVGVLAITSIVLTLPALIDAAHVEVIVITPGAMP